MDSCIQFSLSQGGFCSGVTGNFTQCGPGFKPETAYTSIVSLFYCVVIRERYSKNRDRCTMWESSALWKSPWCLKTCALKVWPILESNQTNQTGIYCDTYCWDTLSTHWCQISIFSFKLASALNGLHCYNFDYQSQYFMMPHGGAYQMNEGEFNWTNLQWRRWYPTEGKMADRGESKSERRCHL